MSNPTGSDQSFQLNPLPCWGLTLIGALICQYLVILKKNLRRQSIYVISPCLILDCLCLILDCLCLACTKSSWSGVSYARTTSPFLFTGVATWGAWNKKWVLLSSLSLTLWDLLHCLSVFSFTSLLSLHADFEILLLHWKSNAAYKCLFALNSWGTFFEFSCFFLLPRDFLFGLFKANRSSSSTWFGNCGETLESDREELQKKAFFNVKKGKNQNDRATNWINLKLLKGSNRRRARKPKENSELMKKSVFF